MDDAIKRLAAYEHKVMAERVIRDAEQRIDELKGQIAEEEYRIEEAKKRLTEANAYLKSIGEQID